jgi:uncharacterized protein involved in exopolysaccharide biosynthesis
MNDDFEIDLRKYMNWIVRSWAWILMLVIIGAVGGLLFSILKPASYQSMAMVVVASSFDTFNFDPKIYSSEKQRNYKAYLDLANSAHMKQMVYGQLSDSEQMDLPFEDFQEEVAIADKGGDESVIIFSIILDDPEKAAFLANYWAQSFTRQANQVFSGQNEAQLTFYQDQLEIAVDAQRKTDQSLADFQANNKLAVFTKQLNNDLKEQEDYLTLLRNINHLEQNATDLREKLASKPIDSTLTQAEETSILLMQIQMYNREMTGSSSMTNVYNPDNGSSSPTNPLAQQLFFMNSDAKSIPVQINIESTNLTPSSSSDALASLDQILFSIGQQKNWIQDQLLRLEPKILVLQESIQTYQNEQSRLIQEQTVARDTTLSLSHKLQEVSISLQYSKTAGPVEIISEAIAPKKPLSRNVLRNTAIAAIAGLLLGILGVFLKNWWKESEPILQETRVPNHSYQS